MTLDKNSRSLIERACEDLDFNLYTDYSGRFMYKQKCFGFVADEPGAELKLAVALINSAVDEEDEIVVLHLIERMSQVARQDSMGLKTIYYYPGIEWGEESDDEEDDEEDEGEDNGEEN